MRLLQNTNRFHSADLAEKAVILSFQVLSWDLKRFVAANDWQEEAIETLRKRRDQFLRVVKGIIQQDAAGVENVKEEEEEDKNKIYNFKAFLCLCDTLIMFNWKLAADYGQEHPIHGLAVKIDREFMRMVTDFVLDNVFITEDENSKSMEKKRINYHYSSK